MLTVPGLLLGMGFAAGFVRLLGASGLLVVPRAAEIHLDLRVIGMGMALGAATTLLFTLAPALRLLDKRLAAAVREGGHFTGGPGAARLRSGLVVAQMAFCVVLLLGAGLLLQSLHALTRIDLGFRPEGALTLPSRCRGGLREPDEVAHFYTPRGAGPRRG
jgi:hypothetical protein